MLLVLQMLLVRSSQLPAGRMDWQRLMIMGLKKIEAEDRARQEKEVPGPVCLLKVA